MADLEWRTVRKKCSRCHQEVEDQTKHKCPKSKIECNVCHQSMTRLDFRNHVHCPHCGEVWPRADMGSHLMKWCEVGSLVACTSCGKNKLKCDTEGGVCYACRPKYCPVCLSSN